MNCLNLFVLVASYANIVLGSYYHGPIAKPVVLQSGYLADTHEVASAKGAHLAALAKGSHHGHGGDYSGAYGHGGDYARSYGHGYAPKYQGPIAIPHVLKSGYLADTHEVAAAKRAHIAALSKQSHYGHGGDYSGSYGHRGDYSGSYGHGGDYSGSYGHGSDYSGSYGHGGDYSGSYGHGHDLRYHGPTAVPHVLSNGHIADTHEVAAAKAEHFVAVSEAKTYGDHGYGYSHNYESHY